MLFVLRHVNCNAIECFQCNTTYLQKGFFIQNIKQLGIIRNEVDIRKISMNESINWIVVNNEVTQHIRDICVAAFQPNADFFIDKTSKRSCKVPVRNEIFIHQHTDCDFKYIHYVNSKGLQNVTNLALLEDVDDLRIINCDLEKVYSNTLGRLTKLQNLMMNMNLISFIHEAAFSEIVNVERIELAYNRISHLHEDTFKS